VILNTVSLKTDILWVISLNEILHEVKRKNQSGVVLKFDFEKAYDKVNWHFLCTMMEKKVLGALGVIG
jgi:hypothetical protein